MRREDLPTFGMPITRIFMSNRVDSYFFANATESKFSQSISP